MTEQKQRKMGIDPDLWRLRAEHGNLWHIRRNGDLWMATRRVDDGTEPTIIEDSPDRLRARLEAPGTRQHCGDMLTVTSPQTDEHRSVGAVPVP